MTTTTLITCMVVLVSMVHGMPTPLTPTEAGLKLKLSIDGINKVMKYAHPLMTEDYGKDMDLKFNIDDKLFEGTFKITKIPTIEIIPLPNDRSPDEHTGFDSVSIDSDSDDSHDRFKRHHGVDDDDHTEDCDESKSSEDEDNAARMRRSTGHAKVMFEDEKFMKSDETASPHDKLGGIQTKVVGIFITMDMKSDGASYVIKATDVTMKVSSIIGSDKGQLKLAKIMAELEGGLTVTKEGVEMDLTTENVQEYYNEILEKMVIRYKKEFTTHVTDFTQVIGSASLPKMLFDFRLTEHPVVTTEYIELSVVGRFVYDTDNTYKYSSIKALDAYTGYSTYLEMFKGAEITSNSTRTTSVFKIVDTEEYPNYNTLMAKTSDEAARVARSILTLTVHQDFINSLYQMLVKSKMLDLTFTPEQIAGIGSLIKGMSGMDMPTEMIPAEKVVRVKVLPVEDDKWVEFGTDKVTERFSVQLGLGSKLSDYTWDAESMFVFKAGEFALDTYKLYLTKKSDEGFPSVLTQELLEDFYKTYLNLISTNSLPTSIIGMITQLSFTDKHFTMGIDGVAVDNFIEGKPY